jgi:FkbM family methyltransferase
MQLTDPCWRKQPVATALRVAESLIRRRVGPLSRPVVPFDAGRSRIRVDLSSALGLQLFRYRRLEPDMQLVKQLLSPGDTFVDGGANVGLFSLVAAAQVGPSGKVIAYEPAPATAQLLRDNIRLSRYDFVDIREEALSDEAGQASFVVFSGDAAGLSGFSPSHANAGTQVTVPTVRLDDSLPDAAKVRVMKLDLEGAEYKALRGAERLLREVSPDILLELEPAHLARTGSSADEVAALLEGHGYRLFEVAPSDPAALLPLRSVHSRTGKSPNVLAIKNLERAGQAGIRIH